MAFIVFMAMAYQRPVAKLWQHILILFRECAGDCMAPSPMFTDTDGLAHRERGKFTRRQIRPMYISIHQDTMSPVCSLAKLYVASNKRHNKNGLGSMCAWDHEQLKALQATGLCSPMQICDEVRFCKLDKTCAKFATDRWCDFVQCPCHVTATCSAFACVPGMDNVILSGGKSCECTATTDARIDDDRDAKR